MKRLAIYTVGLMSALSIGAANAQSFEGFYGQVGVGYESVAPSFSNSNVTVVGEALPPSILQLAIPMALLVL